MWQRYHHDAKGIDVERSRHRLGVMGKPMARNLLAAGSELTVPSCSPGPVDELAGQTGSPVPSCDVVAAAFGTLVERSGGNLDHAALVTLVEDAAGVSLPVAAGGE